MMDAADKQEPDIMKAFSESLYGQWTSGTVSQWEMADTFTVGEVGEDYLQKECYRDVGTV